MTEDDVAWAITLALNGWVEKGLAGVTIVQEGADHDDDPARDIF